MDWRATSRPRNTGSIPCWPATFWRRSRKPISGWKREIDTCRSGIDGGRIEIPGVFPLVLGNQESSMNGSAANAPKAVVTLAERVTHSPEETIQLGREIAAHLQPPCLVLLEGDLGAGKTTLVKGIVAGLGV